MTKKIFRILYTLLLESDHSELVVVKRNVRLDFGIFEEFRRGFCELLLFHVSFAEMEVHKRQLGGSLLRDLKFLDGVVVLFPVEVRLAHKQMELRAVAADFDESGHGALLKFRLLGFPG